MDLQDRFKIEITLETLTSLSKMWRFTIHGDCVDHLGRTTWDIEFEDPYHACSFANTIVEISNLKEIDFRDSVSTINSPVVLTIVV